MKLRCITLASAAAMTLTLVVVMLALGYRVLTDSYSDIEQRHVANHLRRVVDLLSSEVQDLERVTSDYARWDDTWAYMAHPNRTYASSNYGDFSLQNLGVGLVMLVSETGELRYLKNNLAASSLTEADLQKLKRAATVWPAGPRRGRSGFLSFANRIVLISIRPILRSTGDGPCRGTLLMLRDVDERFMSRVSSLSQVPFSFGRINDLTDPLWKEAARSAAKSNAPVAQALDGVREAQYSLLYDYFGEPAFLLRITHEREISLYGRKAMRVLLVLTVVLGLLFGMLNYLLVRRYVVRRVQRLIRFASGVNLEQGLAERINISGKDEIAQLGATLNQMLDQLQLSRDELVATGERLQFEATHDALTGAWNRSAGFEMLDREIDRCSRERTQVAVIMLDLDHFKSVNDQYGHSAGDAVLKTFTAIVSRDLRSFDVLARFGGEEFFIVAPNCSLKEAQGIAHRILHRLRAVPIHVNDTTVHVSASAGVTAGAAPFTSEDMIAVADRAMYRAKEKGRNCVQSEALDPNRSVRAHLFAVQ